MEAAAALVRSTDELLRGDGWFAVARPLRTAVSRRLLAAGTPLQCEGWLFSEFEQAGYIHFRDAAGDSLSFPELEVESWITSGLVRRVELSAELPQLAQPGSLFRPSALAEDDEEKGL